MSTALATRASDSRASYRSTLSTPCGPAGTYDTDALRRRLLKWAEIDTLKRILVSHRSRIEANARETPRELAASLQTEGAPQRPSGEKPLAR